MAALLAPGCNLAAARPLAFDAVALDGVRGVLLDIDDTLYRYAPCHEAGLVAAFRHDALGLGWPDFAIRYRAARDAVTARLEGQGACRSRLFAFQALAEAQGSAQPFARAFALDSAYWEAFLAAMALDAGAARFLQRCADRAVPVCLVTDMTAHVQIRKIARLGIGDAVAHLVTSEEVGAEKPDPRLFDSGLVKLGVAADEAIMLGDSLAKDVAGGLAAGLRAGLVALGGES